MQLNRQKPLNVYLSDSTSKARTLSLIKAVALIEVRNLFEIFNIELVLDLQLDDYEKQRSPALLGILAEARNQ